MDKNTIIGFVLIAAVLIGFSYISKPDPAQTATTTAQVATTDTANTQHSTATDTALQVAQRQKLMQDTTALFASALKMDNQLLTLQNEHVNITLATQGAKVKQVVLKEYYDQQGKPLTLFTGHEANLSYILPTKELNLDTDNYTFTPSNVTDSTATLTLQGDDGEGLVFDYKLLPHSYMVNLSIKAIGMQHLIAPSTQHLALSWHQRIRQQEKGYQFEQQYATLTYKLHETGGSDHLSDRSNETEQIGQPVDWIAFKNQFFSSVIIAYPAFNGVKVASDPLAEGTGYLKDYNAQMQLSFDPTGAKATQLQFYYGPNKYRLLQHMNTLAIDQNVDLNLEDLVYLGWPIFRWINRFFTIYVFDWLTGFGLNMGIVLLLITILMRFIVYPTTKKSYLNSARMRLLKPRAEEIGLKYPNKEDAMKKQQEVMRMYSLYGVSPMGGCLPMLIQLPIWVAMFNFVPNAIELRQQSFLWASDLSTYDDVISWGTHIPLLGNHLSIFCLLFCLSNLAYTYMTMRMQRDSMMGQNDQMKIMQWMMYAMPLIFFFTFNNYSAGLNYYYFISLLLGALTMWYLRKTVNEDRLMAKLEENFKRNQANPEGMKGMGAKLEALRRKQEEQQANLRNRTKH